MVISNDLLIERLQDVYDRAINAGNRRDFFIPLFEYISVYDEEPELEKAIKEIVTKGRQEIKNQTEYADKALEKAKVKYEIIKPLLEMEKRTGEDVEKRAKKFKKGMATLYRWIETFEKFGTVSSLAGNRENCGGKGKSRFPQETEEIINTIINEVYLDDQQLPFSNIYNVIANECKKFNV